MDSDTPIRRRELLVSGGVAAAVLTAGCSGGGEETEGTEEDDTTPTGDGESPTADREETPTETQDENEETPDETEPSAGPLSTEWATPYPDDIVDDDVAQLGDLALGKQRAYVATAGGSSVTAFDLANGEVLWQWEEFAGRLPPLLAYHEAVGPVAILRSEGNNGDVYALDPASGTVQWEYQDRDVGATIAKATDEYVVAGSGTAVLVLDPSDGSLVTKFGRVAGGGDDGVELEATQVDVDQSTLFGVDGFSNKITGYDLETGEQRWQVTDFEMDRIGEVSFVVVDGTPVGTDESSVFGIDPQAGEITFRLDVETVDEGLAGSDTGAFFVNFATPASVQAIDSGQGATDWEQEVRVSGATAPTLAGDRLLVATLDSVTLLDAGTGDIIQEEFDPSSGSEAVSRFYGSLFFAARSDTAVVAGQRRMYGLGIGN